MGHPSRRPGVGVFFHSLFMLLAGAWQAKTRAEEPTKDVLSEEALNKMLGALGDLRAKNLPLNVGSGSLDSEIANLKKQPNVERTIKKRGLSLQEFVLTYKATAQIRQADKDRDNWQRILQDPNATPQAKLEATQKLGDSLKNNLFTREQMELVRRRMPDLESLIPLPK